MSLKSFDKMCENMILGTPGSAKDIFDERQNQVRAKLMIEVFQLYAVLTFIALIIYEAGYPYCESVVAILAFCAAVCYMWWVIRNLFCGSIFGVKYTQTHYTAWTLLAECIMFIFLVLDDTLFADEQEQIEQSKNFFINDGRLSEEIVFIAALAIMIISSVTVLIAVRRKKKEEAAEDSASE